MKRPRPHIPLKVRFHVAYRQAAQAMPFRGLLDASYPLPQRLGQLLNMLFGDEECQLDHDPALILRKFDERTGKYTPDANDPEFLVYLRKDDHQQKTTGRKPGALKTITTKGSDIGLKAKFAKLEGRTKRRPKVKIPQRKNPWQKRKIR